MQPEHPWQVDPTSPFAPFLERQGAVVIDGGLATALEERGLRLDTRLWSASLLLDAPDRIRDVHRAFLEAGADCIATASYQATFRGFAEMGIDEDRAADLMRSSVRLAVEARDAFWAFAGRDSGRLRPLVAASVGPYGAYLADGSEYDGTYGLDESELRDFHGARVTLLAASDADLLAFETIPSLPEARALLGLLDESDAWAWLSFQCRDGRHLADGTPLSEAARACEGVRGVAAVGVNCVAPELVPELIAGLRAVSGLPLLVYPNSGERYDADVKDWAGTAPDVDWETAARSWVRAGAGAVGGCCRVGPAEITRVRAGAVGGGGPPRTG